MNLMQQRSTEQLTYRMRETSLLNYNKTEESQFHIFTL